MLTFRDTNKSFKLDGYLFKTVMKYNFKVDHSNPQDRKTIYEFGKEMTFDIKQKGQPSNRDKSLMKLNHSPAIIASGISTMFLSSDPNQLCDRIKLLVQEKQAGSNSNIINDEIIAIIDKILEYKCICKKQHKQILNKLKLLHTKKVSIYIHKIVCKHKYKYSINCLYTRI